LFKYIGTYIKIPERIFKILTTLEKVKSKAPYKSVLISRSQNKTKPITLFIEEILKFD
jgi:uncharacterized protein YueI